MRRKRVDSSAIQSVGYDPETGTLEVEFQSGSVYDYHGVPDEVYESFLKAPSKGRFFAQEIRSLYDSSRAGG